MKIIYVDDEKALLENFKLTVEGLSKVESLNLFQKGEQALKWIEDHPIDMAFLDVEMPNMNGIELAKRIKEIDTNIHIVFVTAYQQYALEAFGVDATGYLLKPYDREEVEHELEKASRIKPIPKKEIVIQTMPDILVTVDGRTISMRNTKIEELFALLVDRGDVGVTSGEAISCLWEGCSADRNNYWVTFSRLKDKLREEGIEHIIASAGRMKYIHTDQVECDLYQMLAGDEEVIARYEGKYLQRYSWAEERNAQLMKIAGNGEKW